MINISVISLLNEKEFVVNQDIIIKIPTLREYREMNKTQNSYESIMGLFLLTPSDKMVELYDQGIDFTTFDEYDFFVQLFYSEFIGNKNRNKSNLSVPDSTKVFKRLNFSDLTIVKNKQDEIIFINSQGKEILNKRLYMQISSVFCEIFMTKKNRRRPQNEEAKKYIIEVERSHQKHRRKHLKVQSQNVLDEQIIALVCTGRLPYNLSTIQDITIHDFYTCLKQIAKDRNYDHIMNGAYCGFGTVDLKKIKPNQLNWLSFRD
ncbi:MAG: hypothetical protein K2F81_04600 [Ruminococcus sp.]|nr:hypothetical protein [Ruminococcus sp.]